MSQFPQSNSNDPKDTPEAKSEWSKGQNITLFSGGKPPGTFGIGKPRPVISEEQSTPRGTGSGPLPRPSAAATTISNTPGPFSNVTPLATIPQTQRHPTPADQSSGSPLVRTHARQAETNFLPTSASASPMTMQGKKFDIGGLRMPGGFVSPSPGGSAAGTAQLSMFNLSGNNQQGMKQATPMTTPTDAFFNSLMESAMPPSKYERRVTTPTTASTPVRRTQTGKPPPPPPRASRPSISRTPLSGQPSPLTSSSKALLPSPAIPKSLPPQPSLPMLASLNTNVPFEAAPWPKLSDSSLHAYLHSSPSVSQASPAQDNPANSEATGATHVASSADEPEWDMPIDPGDNANFEDWGAGLEALPPPPPDDEDEDEDEEADDDDDEDEDEDGDDDAEIDDNAGNKNQAEALEPVTDDEKSDCTNVTFDGCLDGSYYDDDDDNDQQMQAQVQPQEPPNTDSALLSQNVGQQAQAHPQHSQDIDPAPLSQNIGQVAASSPLSQLPNYRDGSSYSLMRMSGLSQAWREHEDKEMQDAGDVEMTDAPGQHLSQEILTSNYQQPLSTNLHNYPSVVMDNNVHTSSSAFVATNSAGNIQHQPFWTPRNDHAETEDYPMDLDDHDMALRINRMSLEQSSAEATQNTMTAAENNNGMSRQLPLPSFQPPSYAGAAADNSTNEAQSVPAGFSSFFEDECAMIQASRSIQESTLVGVAPAQQQALPTAESNPVVSNQPVSDLDQIDHDLLALAGDESEKDASQQPAEVVARSDDPEVAPPATQLNIFNTAAAPDLHDKSFSLLEEGRPYQSTPPAVGDFPPQTVEYALESIQQQLHIQPSFERDAGSSHQTDFKSIANDPDQTTQPAQASDLIASQPPGQSAPIEQLAPIEQPGPPQQPTPVEQPVTIDLTDSDDGVVYGPHFPSDEVLLEAKRTPAGEAMSWMMDATSRHEVAAGPKIPDLLSRKQDPKSQSTSKIPDSFDITPSVLPQATTVSHPKSEERPDPFGMNSSLERRRLENIWFGPHSSTIVSDTPTQGADNTPKILFDRYASQIPDHPELFHQGPSRNPNSSKGLFSDRVPPVSIRDPNNVFSSTRPELPTRGLFSAGRPLSYDELEQIRSITDPPSLLRKDNAMMQSTLTQDRDNRDLEANVQKVFEKQALSSPPARDTMLETSVPQQSDHGKGVTKPIENPKSMPEDTGMSLNLPGSFNLPGTFEEQSDTSHISTLPESTQKMAKEHISNKPRPFQLEFQTESLDGSSSSQESNPPAGGVVSPTDRNKADTIDSATLLKTQPLRRNQTQSSRFRSRPPAIILSSASTTATPSPRTQIRAEIKDIQNQIATSKVIDTPATELFSRLHERKQRLQDLEEQSEPVKSRNRNQAADTISIPVVTEALPVKHRRSLLSYIPMVRPSRWVKDFLFSCPQHIVNIGGILLGLLMILLFCIITFSTLYATFFYTRSAVSNLLEALPPSVELHETSLWNAHSDQANFTSQIRYITKDAWYYRGPLGPQDDCVAFLKHQSDHLNTLQSEEQSILTFVQNSLTPNIHKTLTDKKPSVQQLADLKKFIAQTSRRSTRLERQIIKYGAQGRERSAVCDIISIPVVESAYEHVLSRLIESISPSLRIDLNTNLRPTGIFDHFIKTGDFTVSHQAISRNHFKNIEQALLHSQRGHVYFRTQLDAVSEGITRLAELWFSYEQAKILEYVEAWDRMLWAAASRL